MGPMRDDKRNVNKLTKLYQNINVQKYFQMVNFASPIHKLRNDIEECIKGHISSGNEVASPCMSFTGDKDSISFRLYFSNKSYHLLNMKLW